MRFAQYEPLAKWASEHHVHFSVDWYPDCHILSAWHELGHDNLVSWAYVRYSHDGRKVDLRPWGCDSTLKEFVAMFDEMRKHAPLQPTSSDEYKEVTA